MKKGLFLIVYIISLSYLLFVYNEYTNNEKRFSKLTNILNERVIKEEEITKEILNLKEDLEFLKKEKKLELQRYEKWERQNQKLKLLLH